MVGREREHRAEIGDGFVVVARGVLRIAEPEQRGRVVAALRIALHELGEGGLGLRELPRAEDAQGCFEVGLFLRIGVELAAVDRDLGRLVLLELVVDGGLARLHFAQRARELLVLAGHACQFAAHLLDLALQVEQAATQLAVFVGQALVGLLAHGFDALAQVEDGAARLVVLEQRRLRAGRRAEQGGGEGRASPQGTWLHHRV
ncbi:hypothetical protein D3C85_528750 [compost metagenome]